MPVLIEQLLPMSQVTRKFNAEEYFFPESKQQVKANISSNVS
jgi:hypothetical protein